MILERIRHTIQRQDWFAVFLEVVIVVGSIVLGFQITAWGDERNAREEEQDLLRGLRTEFATNISIYDQTVAEQRVIIEQARQMLHWTGPNPVQIDTSLFDSLLVSLISDIPMFHPAMGEISAILGSGQLVLIQNDSIRTAVAAWPYAVELLREKENEARSDVMERFYPYVLERIPLLTMDRRMGYVDFPRPSRFRINYERLLSEVAFENHIEDRWVLANFILEEGEPVRQALVDLIRLIDNELHD